MKPFSNVINPLRFWLLIAISTLFLSCCTMIMDADPSSRPAQDNKITKEVNDQKAEADEEMRQGKEKAKIIIDALSKYQQDNGKYPDTLQELIPGYLQEIPQTDNKQNYQYLQRLQGIYELWFLVEKKNGVSCSYSSRFEDWECSFSAEP